MQRKGDGVDISLISKVLSAIGVLIVHGASAGEIPDGTYICMTDRQVGFQPSEGKAEERYSGKIKPPDNIQKFFIDVEEKREDDEGPIKYNTLSKFLCHDVYTKQKLDGYMNANEAADIEGYFSACLQKYVLTIHEGSFNLHYDSTNKNIFREVSTFNEFWLLGDYRFTWVVDYGETSYLREGRCTPSK